MHSFTPGPWEWVGSSIESKSAEAERTAPNYGTVMELEVQCGAWCQGGTARIETLSDADARLIAAAPELLEVCEQLAESAEYWSEYDVPLGIVDKLKAAIAKAKGEPS